MEPELTATDREILITVVHRFVNYQQPTSRRALILKFKSPDRLNELRDLNFFRILNNDKYRPTFLAFQFCGDSELLRNARRSSAIVLRTLRNLFEVEIDKTQFSYAEIEHQAQEIYDIVDMETLKLGLYLSQDFGFFSGWIGNQDGTEIASVGIDERIITVEDFDCVWDEEVRRRMDAQDPTASLQFSGLEQRLTGREEVITTHERGNSALATKAAARKARLREILDELSELRLCGPSDDPDEQTSVSESYKYLLTHVKKLSRGLVSREVGRELDELSPERIDSIYDVYQSKANLDAIAVDLIHDLDNLPYIEDHQQPYFIAPEIIENLRKLRPSLFDLTKLVGYCEEINSSFSGGNVVACLLLMRTVINHIPPIFGAGNFPQVAAQSGRSLKENLAHLDVGLRKLADLHAHQVIRIREEYPTKNQVEPFRPHFELLLHEVLTRLK